MAHDDASGHGPRRLLTVEEAADLAGVSRSRAYELIARRTWRSTKIGNTRRVDRLSVEEWIEAVLDEGDDQ
jgi:excisionase family DNA binding protein